MSQYVQQQDQFFDPSLNYNLNPLDADPNLPYNPDAQVMQPQQQYNPGLYYFDANNPQNFNNNMQNGPSQDNFYNEFINTFDLLPGNQVKGFQDIEVSAALASLIFNVIIFVILMGVYEFIRRLIPSVYNCRNNHSDPSSNRPTIDIPKSIIPLSWLPTVIRTSWKTVQKCGGLDAYFFLRFIRLCLRITTVTAIWGMIVLWPVFATGGQLGTHGWYLFSMANVTQGNWRIWIPSCFMWFLTLYVFFTMNEEYKHFVALRMQYLVEGDDDMNPQTQHSLLIEEIPRELRSDLALYSYFDSLFPGKIHSATVVLNIPDLEKLSAKRKRAVRRLEKSLAYYEANGKRTTHIVGRKRFQCCGIETSPIFSFGGKVVDDDESRSPQRGERVDSINYYRAQLDMVNEKVVELQNEKIQIAEDGNETIRASEWVSHMLSVASDTALSLGGNTNDEGLILGFRKKQEQFGSIFKFFAGDFLFGGFSLVKRNIDVVVDTVRGTTMSSTGFVTFNDLTSKTLATRAPLNHDPDTLIIKPAPDSKRIIWKNAHINYGYCKGRTIMANILLGLGAILWSIPVASIQALATVEHIAKIPGFGWMSSLNGGSVSNFVNGYLPVVILLYIIHFLPEVFNWVAVKFERCKTETNVQSSILGRYFYYQLANIYISLTAGSIWTALGTIIDHPGSALEILGRSVPTVVGYFVTLLMTKTLAGLPMSLLRPSRLMRFVFLRLCFRQKYLTQRELDEVYKIYSFQGGWQYPNQLLVIVICFTYACISPIILPVGAIYFLAALIVFKKKVLVVYSSGDESGGDMFPAACHRMLIGLVCGQITLIGYCILREGFYQTFLLVPLPILTFFMMNTFQRLYAEPSQQLSLERATAFDQRSMVKIGFREEFYRQPVLAEGSVEPLPYRRSMRPTQTTGRIHSQSFLGKLHDDHGSNVRQRIV